jgi:redox-sensing transcriptional repressor
MPMGSPVELPRSGDDAEGLGAIPPAGPAAENRAPARVPEATAGRLPSYLHALHGLAEHGAATVSSHALAARVGVSPAKLRKDLSFLGSFGTRGVGYDVGYLVHAISSTLGVADEWEVAIAGLGNLGRALAQYEGFAGRGLRVSILFDADPAVVGTRFGDLVVHHIDDAPQVVREAGISIGVVAVPASAAQGAAERLVAGGVTSLLTFAAAALDLPEHVHVRHVDLSAELQLLGFREFRRVAGVDLAAAAHQATGARTPA